MCFLFDAQDCSYRHGKHFPPVSSCFGKVSEWEWVQVKFHQTFFQLQLPPLHPIRLFTFYFSLDKLNRLLSGEKILLFSRRRENISSVSVPVVSPSPTTKVGAVGEGSSSSGGGSSSRSSPLKQHSASPLLMRSYTSPLAHSPAWKKNE